MEQKLTAKSDLDCVRLYAVGMGKKPDLFNQQKMIINSQIKSSKSFFRNLFKGKNFKTEARKYLKGRNLI